MVTILVSRVTVPPAWCTDRRWAAGGSGNRSSAAAMYSLSLAPVATCLVRPLLRGPSASLGVISRCRPW